MVFYPQILNNTFKNKHINQTWRNISPRDYSGPILTKPSMILKFYNGWWLHSNIMWLGLQSNSNADGYQPIKKCTNTKRVTHHFVTFAHQKLKLINISSFSQKIIQKRELKVRAEKFYGWVSYTTAVEEAHHSVSHQRILVISNHFKQY